MNLTKHQLIALSGYAKSGKDTIADTLVNYGYVKVAFADSLKDAIASIYGLDRLLLDDWDYKNSPHLRLGGQTPRVALQYLGQSLRDFYANTWVDNTMCRVYKLLQQGQQVVISDVRYLNEANACLEWGAALVSVVRPSLNLADATYSHQSEAYIEDIRQMAYYVVDNSSSLDELKRRVINTFCVTPHT
jgi:hypothetical protein